MNNKQPTSNKRTHPDKSAIVIIGLFVAALGSYLVLPFYVVHAIDELGLLMSQVSILLTLIALIERGFGFFGGHLVDKYNAKFIILAGIGLRGVSLVLLALATNFLFLLIAALISSVGSALFQVGGKSALLIFSNNNMQAYAKRNIALNLGIAIGPLMGYLLLPYSFSLVCLVNASLFAALFLYYFSLLPSFTNSNPSEYKKLTDCFILLKNSTVRLLVFCQTAFYFLFVNLNLIFPVYAKTHFSMLAIGAMFTLNSIIVLTFNLSIAKLVTNKPVRAHSAFLLFVACFFLIAISDLVSSPYAIYFFYAGVILFSLAEIFFMLIIEIQIVNELGHEFTGRSLGISAVGAMVGVGAGNIILGPLYAKFDLAGQVAIFWFGLAIISTAFYCRLRYSHEKIKAQKIEHCVKLTA